MSTPIDSSRASGVGGINPFQGMSLETMVMVVLSERHQTMENMVMDQIKAMQEKNLKLKQLGELSATITARMKDFPADAKSDTKINKYKEKGETVNGKNVGTWLGRRADFMQGVKVKGDPNKPGEYYDNAREYVKNRSDWSAETKARVLEDLELGEAAAAMGVNVGTNGEPIAFVVNDVKYGALEALQAKVKSQTDALTNDTQLEQIRLQSLMSKVQNLAQMLSNMVKKFDDTHGALIRNI